MFDEFDVNGNKELEKDEIKQILLLGMGYDNAVNMDVFDEMIGFVDKDNDGTVNISEFMSS